MTNPYFDDPAMRPAASFTPACIGYLRDEGRARPGPYPATHSVRAVAAGSEDRRDGPVCTQHLRWLQGGVRDRDGREVTLESFGPLEESRG